MIGRTVAIKLFPASLAAGDGRELFMKEARVVGQISHPAIIAVHDMGIDESSSTPYLVMEYVEGQPLERMLDKGSIPFPRACAWVAEVAMALGVAHRKGIIHGAAIAKTRLFWARLRIGARSKFWASRRTPDPTFFRSAWCSTK